MSVCAYTVVDPSVIIGPYTKVWHFTTIEFGVSIGENGVIGSHCYIGAFSTLGDEVRLQTGVFLPRHSVIGNRVFIGPNATFTDDKYPCVRGDYNAMPPVVEDEVSIGAGAVILPGVRIGKRAVVGAGATVTHDVKAGTTVAGVPAFEIKDSEGRQFRWKLKHNII